jgi:hypothetical protein
MGTLFPWQIAAQIDDGVSDQLAWAVIRYVAAAIDLVELDAALGEFFVAGKDVGAVGVAAERQNGRVLQHQKRVTNQILLSRRDDLLLDGESLAVWDATEIEEIDVHELFLRFRRL